MAKPIRATPTLNHDESVEFIKNMLLTEKRTKPTKTEKMLIEALSN